MVACGSDQGRSVFVTAGVARLRQGLRKRENAGLGRKLPFLDGHWEGNLLLTGYTKQIFRPECNPQFQSLHCIARLNEDVSGALPYINAVLGGAQFLEDPPEVMFHHQGRIIKIGPREIALNALKDEQQADELLTWLMNEINQAWDKRASIEPSRQGQKRPVLIEVLKLLPKTNCRKCGLATCMVFAAQMVAGGRSVEQCPELSAQQQDALTAYVDGFKFD